MSNDCFLQTKALLNSFYDQFLRQNVHTVTNFEYKPHFKEGNYLCLNVFY